MRPVGRESELDLVEGFLDDERQSGTLLLLGAAGIGKTTLWEAGTASARKRGRRVMATRASAAEARLSFGGLVDLLDGIDLQEIDGLPTPQRSALEVALLRAEPHGDPPEAGAIALGFLNVVRALARERPVLLAVDDVQWLDAPSGEVLAFAARRLGDTPAALLLAKRSGPATPVEQALRPERIEVGPLSLGAIRRLLAERLGLSLSRALVRRIADSTVGNPLFALELGRLLVERGLPTIADELPVPEAVEQLLDARVADVSPAARRLLLAVALGPELRVSQLARLARPDELDETVDAGLLVLDRDRLRPSHPLLAAAARTRSQRAERRAIHLELAGLAADEELRARHLALATEVPDEAIAATVAAAAEGAAARGARRDAVELGEQALRLTPTGSAARGSRVLALASALETAAELEWMTELLHTELASLPPGALRARAWLLLAEGVDVHTVADYRQQLERALAEALDDPALRALVVAKLSSAVIAVERIPQAEARLLAVLDDAHAAGPEVERPVLYALAWARALGGRPLDDVLARYAAGSESPGYLAWSPERVAAQRLVWRGEIAAARAAVARFSALAEERGEPISQTWARIHLCELALRVGDWATAARLLDEWAETSDGELIVTPAYERCRGLLAAGRGLPEEAERWAGEAIARAQAVGTQWDWLEGLRTRGVAALLRHDPAGAAESLRTAWEHTVREGVDEPGVFPVAPELVEALVELGETSEADAVVARLARLADELQHPWARVTARRCEAIVRGTAPLLEQAAAEYGALGLRLDRARSLLALGRAQRRRRKWAAARTALGEALRAFEELDAPGWVDEVQAELARVGARRPAPAGALTPAERQVAALAASGCSNKEIARALFVSVKTVEFHLSRTYAKLGVRSRTQLAQRLA